MTPESIAAAIAAGRALTSIHQVEGHKVAIVHQSDSEVSVLAPEKLAAPRFLTAAPTFHDPAAFVAYVESFKRPWTRIFNDGNGKFLAVFDYHDDKQARHADHTALLVLTRSPEWKVWADSSEKKMGQQTFAEFIEDNLKDILATGDVTPEFMMQVATGLHATTGSTFRQAINLANGQVEFQYDTQIQGTVRGDTKAVPTAFQVALRPYMGSDRYPVDCRLRYRAGEGGLSLHYKALHLTVLTEAAIDQVVEVIHTGTAIKPALGWHNAQAVAAGV